MNQAPFNPTDVSFSNVADLYLAELRGGTNISIELLAKTFPHLADDIRAQLPALALLEKSSENKRHRQSKVESEQEIGGCTIDRELGRGAMGVVYQAVQKDIGRQVAIKIIPLSGGRPLGVERFEIEAQAMGRMDHPNITPVFDFGHDAEHAFLVMKLIDGLSLADLQDGHGTTKQQFQLSELRRDWMALAKLALDAASGLQHAHEKGLVHRDIKPANLLLDGDGKIWITDFGLAKIYDYTRSLSATGDAVGTPRYMAPEQVRGIADVRSDIYSLGLTLYELVAGKQVWSDKSNLSIVAQRPQLTLPAITELCEDIPDNFASVIMKCCEFDPDSRFQSAAELCTVLSRFLEGKKRCDRRRGKRLTDEQYQAKSRRQMVAVTVGLCSVCTLGALWSVLPGKAQTTPVAMAAEATIPPSAATLIDQLADSDNENMLEIVTQYVSDAIDETSDKMNYSDHAKQELRQQVDKLTDKIKERGGVSEDELHDFLQEYRQSSLPAASRIMRVTLVLQRSNLSEQERAWAVATLRHLATAVANEFVSEAETQAMLQSLVGPDPAAQEHMELIAIPDDHLRGWLGHVHNRLTQLPPQAFDIERALNSELGSAFTEAFGTAPE